jgi:predicted nuclease of predicted toxin-antitoxin system
VKLLADANVEAGLVEWLRTAGHDVTWALMLPAGTSDNIILELARADGRVIPTHDRDFGELVFKRRLPALAVCLMRFSAGSEAERINQFRRWWPTVEELLVAGQFVVISDDAIRARPLPSHLV